MDMRGLSVFISEIRKCTTKEQEQKRVDKELAKIRGKFKTSGMKGYDRKKYVCKLLYIYMLGYEIDFGHIEAVNLLSSEKYSEKHTGYLACTLLLHENHELVTLITNCIKRDLNNKNSYDEQCLGLTALANIGGKEQAEALAADVQKLLVSADTRLIVRKKAALTLLNMYRKYPELLPPDQWSARILSLLANKDLGVITSVMSLLLGFVAADPTPYFEAVPKIIRLLGKFANIREIPPNYLYYGIVAPWLQVKCLRLLQYYDAPTDPTLTQAVGQVIQRAFAAAERAKQMDKSKSVSRTNAAHAVLFESLNVLIHYDNDEQQLINAANLLGRYLQDKDPNLRYLALDTMSRLAYTSHKEVKASIRKHQMTVLLALKDPDISIRRRALDLLYHMCNHSNASQIVGELLEYLPLSNYEIREELVLKVAILAERFAQDFTWYVEVILNLITQAGDFVSEEIWHRVVQIVTNRDEALQKDTADRVFRVVAAPASHENSVKVAGYILGEYGHLVGDREETSGSKQFDVLHHKFDLVSINTKALLLNAYIKFYHVYEDAELRGKIKQVFEQHRNFIDAELQQRANEYFNLANSNDSKLMNDTLAAIPPFPERESSVMKKILERQTQSRAIRVDKQAQQQEEEEQPEETEQEEAAPAPAKEHDLLGELESAPETKPVAPAASSGLLDLDDLLGAPAPTPAPVAARTVQPQPASIDPFFSEPNLAQSAAAAAAAKAKQREAQGVSIDDMIASNKQEDAEMSKTVHADAEQKYKQLIINSSGTAIEDQHLAVKIQSEFHGSKGRVVLAYGNKTDYPISKVRADLTSAPQVDVQPSQVPPLIAAKSQAQQYLSIDCLMPFSDNIFLSLYFEFERKTYKFYIKLPIVPHKFIEPQQLNGSQAFFTKWNSIPKGAPLEIQDIVKPQNTVNPERAKSLFSTGFRFALLGGVDPNPNNIVASGVFHSQQGQQDILARLETNSNVNAYRLTVRSTNAVVSSQVFASLKAALLDL